MLYIFLFVFALAAYFVFPVVERYAISWGLNDRAVRFQKNSFDTATSLLVLGDSTGVGVGAAKPEDTVAGRFAAFLNATYVENHAVSGAVVADLPGQIAKAKLSHYSVILLQIGANDIIRFHNVEMVTKNLSVILDTLPKADKIFLMSAGNVGGATIFPSFIRPRYTRATLAYHAAFGALAKVRGITYVNLYRKPEDDPFAKEPEKYLAADGLHPSSEGYRTWFEALAETLH